MLKYDRLEEMKVEILVQIADNEKYRKQSIMQYKLRFLIVYKNCVKFKIKEDF